MRKQHLEPNEVLKVALANIIHGVEHPVLAFLFDVNQGRIAEAVMAVRYTMEHHKELYRVAVGKMKIVPVNGEDERAVKLAHGDQPDFHLALPEVH